MGDNDFINELQFIDFTGLTDVEEKTIKDILNSKIEPSVLKLPYDPIEFKSFSSPSASEKCIEGDQQEKEETLQALPEPEKILHTNKSLSEALPPIENHNVSLVGDPLMYSVMPIPPGYPEAQYCDPWVMSPMYVPMKHYFYETPPTSSKKNGREEETYPTYLDNQVPFMDNLVPYMQMPNGYPYLPAPQYFYSMPCGPMYQYPSAMSYRPEDLVINNLPEPSCKATELRSENGIMAPTESLESERTTTVNNNSTSSGGKK